MRTGKYDLEERLLEYATRIIRLAEALPKTRTGNHVAGQLLRSGTAPLPNHGEAQAAESRDDFVHKLKICLIEGIASLVAVMQTSSSDSSRVARRLASW